MYCIESYLRLRKGRDGRQEKESKAENHKGEGEGRGGEGGCFFERGRGVMEKKERGRG
jgi:hypothetical protein